MRSDNSNHGGEDVNRRRFLATIGLVGSGTMLAGCAGMDNQEGTETTETTEGGDDGGDGSNGGNGNGNGDGSGQMVVGTRLGELSTLDPALINRDAELQLLVNLYDGLIKLNDDLDVEPDLAKDWEWVSDTEVVFNLREGIQFHNGDTMTAEDVKFTYERVLDEETGSPWRDQLLAIDEITADDDTTVTFQLSETYAPLEFVMVRKNMAGCILSKEAVENGVDPASEAIGTGPFQLANWESGSGIELQRFDDYWKEDAVNLDTVSVDFIPDPTTLTTALEADDIAMMDTVRGQDLDRLRGNQNLQVYESGGINVRYVGFNARDNSVFSDTQLRQAASLSINRENFVQVLGQEFQPNPSPIPQALQWVYRDDLPMQSQDTEQAQQLLEDADAMGTEVVLIIWEEQPWRQMAEVVQSMMNEVGFNVDLQVYESGTFWELVEEEEGSGFDAFVLGWTGLTDPDQYLYPQFSTGGSWNWIGYSNSELDEILEESRRVVDRSERKELYSQAQEIIAEDAAYACLASQKDFQASRDYVQGYEMPPTGTYRFEDVSLDR